MATDFNFQFGSEANLDSLEEMQKMIEDIEENWKRIESEMEGFEGVLDTPNKSLEKQNQLVAALKPKWLDTQRVISDVSAKIEQQAASVNDMQAAMRPDLMRSQAEQDVRAEETRKRYKAELEKEKQKVRDEMGIIPEVLKVKDGIPTVKPAPKKEMGGASVQAMMGAMIGGGGLKGLAGAGLAQIGGMAGGPVGMAIQFAPQIAQAVGEIGAMPTKAAVAGLKGVSGGLKDLQSGLGPIALAFSAVEAPLKAAVSAAESIPIIGDYLAPMLKQLAMVPGVLQDITSSLVSMAGMTSPGQMKLFRMAVEDVQGVIGQSFMPMFEMLREGVRFFGDVLATILPSMREVEQVLAPLRSEWESLRSALRGLLEEIAPIIRAGFIGALRFLAFNLELATGLLARFTRGVTMFLSPLVRFARSMGLGVGGGMRSSVGAAARQASIQDISSYQNQLITAAFSMSSRPSTGERTVNHLQTISNTLTNIYNFITSAATSTARASGSFTTGFAEGARRSLFGW